MRMDDNADAKRILLASPPADWRKQLGHPRITWLSTVQQDLKQHHRTLPEAADLAQNRPLWRMMSRYGAMQRELHARNDEDDDQQSQINYRWYRQTILPVPEINLKTYTANNPDTNNLCRELNSGHASYCCHVTHTVMPRHHWCHLDRLNQCLHIQR